MKKLLPPAEKPGAKGEQSHRATSLTIAHGHEPENKAYKALVEKPQGGWGFQPQRKMSDCKSDLRFRPTR